jgi:uncharacterized protein YecE (DUF72 family)
MSESPIHVGCAGWSLPKEHSALFGAKGSHLHRYAQRFDAVEINSSFYRSHRVDTYRRWADATPDYFRFAIKLPKQITHINRLTVSDDLIEKFSAEIAGLGEKRGPVLVQLPPSLSFEETVANGFFASMHSHVQTAIVCEPRHLTWFSPKATALLREHGIGRVAADPSIEMAAAVPDGCPQHAYFRWHGSPRMYYSEYDVDALNQLKSQVLRVAPAAEAVWCIFDNTAAGAAIVNAVTLAAMLNPYSLAGSASAPT